MTYGLYLIGALIFQALQIRSVAKAKNNPLNQQWLLWRERWFEHLVRLLVGLALYRIWAVFPAALPKLVSLFVPLSPAAWELLILPAVGPGAGAVAFLAGLAVDPGLSFLTGRVGLLRAVVPKNGD